MIDNRFHNLAYIVKHFLSHFLLSLEKKYLSLEFNQLNFPDLAVFTFFKNTKAIQFYYKEFHFCRKNGGPLELDKDKQNTENFVKDKTTAVLNVTINTIIVNYLCVLFFVSIPLYQESKYILIYKSFSIFMIFS